MDWETTSSSSGSSKHKEEEEEEEEEEDDRGCAAPCSALTLNEAVTKLKRSFPKKKREVWLAQMLADCGIKETADRVNLSSFARDYPEGVHALQKQLNLRLVIVQARKGQNPATMCNRLIYDGRHALGPNHDDTPLRCLVLKAGGDLMHLTDNVASLKPIHSSEYKLDCFKRTRPLLKLLRQEDDAGGSSLEDARNSWRNPGRKEEEEEEEEEAEDGGRGEGDPQTEEALRRFLVRHCPPETKVRVCWMTGIKKKRLALDWLQYLPPDQPLKRVVDILAYPGRDYSIRYAEATHPGLKTAIRRGKKTENDYQLYRKSWRFLQAQQKEQGKASAYQTNHSAAVSANHSGLLLAFDLGLVSAEELNSLSGRLAQTQSTLFVFLDEANHLRHVTYYDGSTSFCTQVVCFENDCEQDNEGMTDHQFDREMRYRDQAADTMISFWQRVWQRRDHWVTERQKILRPVTERLESIVALTMPKTSKKTKKKKKNKKEEEEEKPPRTDREDEADKENSLDSPFSRCLKNLRQTIHHQYLFMCTKEDSHMHSIKFYLTLFGYETVKSFRGVSLKGQSDDTLVKLSIPGMVVFNLNTFFCCNEDQEFYAGATHPLEWTRVPPPSQVLVSHADKNLRYQKLQVADNKSVSLTTFCHARGRSLARHIYNSWQCFGSFLLSTFGFEINGQATMPATSFLAFQCVWNAFLKRAGPLAQSIERSKPYHEDLIRDNSRGGFMFSIQTKLSSDEPLSGAGKRSDRSTPKAKSIAEFDLTSAYGFAASKLLIPSGFATGFRATCCRPDAAVAAGTAAAPTAAPTAADGSAHRCALERLDKRARHRSFEFRAVYKFLDVLTRLQKVKIRTAYHNYSGAGVFTLGKYNLDLCVVSEEGDIWLVNMDSQYCHGCRKCVTPAAALRQRFVDGQSHESVCERSEKRDAHIRAWVDAFNASFPAGGPADENSAAAQKKRAHYGVIYDCHTPEFTTRELERDFREEPSLRALVEGYRVTDRCGNGELDLEKFERLVSDPGDSSFTFIGKATVSITPADPATKAAAAKPVVVSNTAAAAETNPNDYREAAAVDDKDKDDEDEGGDDDDSDGSYSVGPLIVYDAASEPPPPSVGIGGGGGGRGEKNEEEEEEEDDLLWTTDRRSKRTIYQRLAWNGTVVLTRDYYLWLLRTFGPDRFRIHHVDFVLFYKTEPVLNGVYSRLVDLRATTSDPVLKTFIKRLQNLSAGYFGTRSSQLNTRTTYRLVNGLPKNYAFYRHWADTRFSVDLRESSFFLLETKPWPRLNKRRAPSKNAVPLFLAIVEYGKLRLLEILHFLREHLVPGSFRLAYSNVDNLILALSTPTLEEAVAEDRRASFSENYGSFFSAPSQKIPGRAELKWTVSGEDPWNFITLRTQHYVLGSPCQSTHRVSGLSQLSSQEAYDFAERQLRGIRVEVIQRRRLCKMGGVATRNVLYEM